MAAGAARKAARENLAKMREIERDVKKLNGKIHSKNGSASAKKRAKKS